MVCLKETDGQTERGRDGERNTQRTPEGPIGIGGRGPVSVLGNSVAKWEPEPEYQACCVILGKSLALSEYQFTDTRKKEADRPKHL